MLTEHQQGKFHEVIALLNSGRRRVILQGLAGVGKTTLAGEIVRHLYDGISDIYVTAPTNKALAVLRDKVSRILPVEFRTIHSALKLKRWINPVTGIVTFTKEKGAEKYKDYLESAKVCIIDEASMLNTEIESLLGKYKDLPIIYIGDNHQLSPIGEPESPIFGKSYPVVELTEIVRQEQGNPIIGMSRDLSQIYLKIPKIVNGRGYIYDNSRSKIISNLADVNGTDDLKYLAYTNEEVDSVNKAVRIKRYGNPARIEKEETLVFNTPHGDYYTNMEAKVERLDVVEGDVKVPTFHTRYRGTSCLMNDMKSIKLKYYKVNESFTIIHEDSDRDYEAITAALKENSVRRRWDWRGYFFFIEQFADIKYNHAITIHKSQGSTYKKAVINIRDVARCRDKNEKERLLYTAVTRPSDLVIFNQVR